MKEFIDIYQEHKEEIELFIIATLENNGSISEVEPKNYHKNFQSFPSMELVYITDEKFIQIAPNVYRSKIIEEAIDKDRSYLVEKLKEKNSFFSFSKPYLSSATGNICITVMKKEGQKNVFIDFKLSALLARLGFIELHETFDGFTKQFYKGIGFSLMFFASLAIGYAFISFISHFIEDGFTLDTLFKPIVSVTLGLAIFDLAKTILEREVYYKSYGAESEDSMVLSKFSIAIIIALSIEALMVVFKIALHDYTQMIYGLYLIIGVALTIVSLGIYNYLSGKHKE